MVHVFRLGPLDVGGRKAYAYGGVADGELLPPAVAHSDAKGLRNAKGMLPTTLVGRATLEGRTLRLECNSRERADRLRTLVVARFGPLASFRIGDNADPVAGIGTGGRSAIRRRHTSPRHPRCWT